MMSKSNLRRNKFPMLTFAHSFSSERRSGLELKQEFDTRAHAEVVEGCFSFGLPCSSCPLRKLGPTTHSQLNTMSWVPNESLVKRNTIQACLQPDPLEAFFSILAPSCLMILVGFKFI